jgi:putative cell wall-binding protein
VANAVRAGKKPAVKKKTSTKKKWSASVTKHSNALDLESNVFKSGSAEKIAQSLKRSSSKSKRKKGTPYQSAMSMLNFYINRAGKNLSARQKKTLENAKEKLRKVFHREDEGKH